MSDNTRELYNRFKNILSGCTTLSDAIYYAEIMSLEFPYLHDLFLSAVYSNTYVSMLDTRTLKNVILEIENYVYREDVEEFLKKRFKETLNEVQKKTFDRIINTKQIKPINSKNIEVYEIKKHDDEIKEMSCPHCKTQYFLNKNTEYVICGYTDNHNGYDWKGCNRDWCFKCGKMLCKSWQEHKLYVNDNQNHNSKCCREHAKKYNNKYPNDYCQCRNKNVNRDIYDNNEIKFM